MCLLLGAKVLEDLKLLIFLMFFLDFPIFKHIRVLLVLWIGFI